MSHTVFNLPWESSYWNDHTVILPALRKFVRLWATLYKKVCTLMSQKVIRGVKVDYEEFSNMHLNIARTNFLLLGKEVSGLLIEFISFELWEVLYFTIMNTFILICVWGFSLYYSFGLLQFSCEHLYNKHTTKVKQLHSKQTQKYLD